MPDDTRDSAASLGPYRRWHTPALIFCMLPMLIYPGVFVAGVMGLSALPRDGSWSTLEAAAAVFLCMSLAYPIWWGVSAVVFWFVSRAAGAVMALAYLAACVGLFCLWYWRSG